jgi:hypothetical protein
MLTCALLSLAMGAAKTPDRRSSREPPPGFRQWREAGKARSEGRDADAQKIMDALRIDHRFFDESLEGVEHVDFLVTPALLVQEAVSDGVILTYPEE